MSESTVNLTIDGRAVRAVPGTNLIEAARLAGIEIPHFCYHPQLPIAGNCRMCLVEVGLPKLGADRKPELDSQGQPLINFAPKLTIACNATVSAGMVVLTRTPKVIKARRGVMEFLLINHPLDCPICDQAGECRLQELAVDYGQGCSRFVEEKEHKPKRTPLGPKIMLDDERCILCSRCIRFMREVAGQDCLGFTHRGSRSTLICYPGQEPATNYDLNIVDICPVGALTSTDFRFRQRVWFLKETPSICPHCATGCNTVVWSREGVVYRQTPRDNPAVNQCWMCDLGRLNYKFINDPNRLTTPLIGGQPANWLAAIAHVAQRLNAIRATGGQIAGVGAARATTEELFLFGKLFQGLESKLLDSVPRSGASDKLLLNSDRNPNMRGAQLAGVAANPPGHRLAAIADGIASGAIKALLVLGEDVTSAGIGPDLLAKLELLVTIDILPSAMTQAAHVVLPGASFAEKGGTFINAKGRMQQLNPAVASPGQARPEWQILSELLAAVSSRALRDGQPRAANAWKKPAPDFPNLGKVFAAMAAEAPALADLTLESVGAQGVQIKE
ncbi:MAG: 2Fe-2S iron-sulfur cluster binding domain-containing protein [Verrucomicrobia bacterium]|nr:MAG: 2Fe-2S iron-sulfur cluster binding domain-containing protein [Verrucomicrobiota bacterium]